jgi:hypothetical protein
MYQEIEVVCYKCPVLEEAKQEQVVGDADAEPEFPSLASLHESDSVVVECSRVNDQQEVKRIPPPIEEIGGCQKPMKIETSVPQRKVDRVKDGEKDDEFPAME